MNEIPPVSCGQQSSGSRLQATGAAQVPHPQWRQTAIAHSKIGSCCHPSCAGPSAASAGCSVFSEEVGASSTPSRVPSTTASIASNTLARAGEHDFVMPQAPGLPSCTTPGASCRLPPRKRHKTCCCMTQPCQSAERPPTLPPPLPAAAAPSAPCKAPLFQPAFACQVIAHYNAAKCILLILPCQAGSLAAWQRPTSARQSAAAM